MTACSNCDKQWQEVQRLNSLMSHHVGNRYLAEERAKKAEALLDTVRECYSAWNIEGLGYVPEIEYTNYPDAWRDIGAALAVVEVQPKE